MSRSFLVVESFTESVLIRLQNAMINMRYQNYKTSSAHFNWRHRLLEVLLLLLTQAAPLLRAPSGLWQRNKANPLLNTTPLWRVLFKVGSSLERVCWVLLAGCYRYMSVFINSYTSSSCIAVVIVFIRDVRSFWQPC